jgi:hypothetical protein
MIDLVGWLGALLVVASYAQRDTVRLRQVSLLASVALLSFNLVLGIWPNVALELALVVVNVRRLVQSHGSSLCAMPSPHHELPLGVGDPGRVLASAVT